MDTKPLRHLVVSVLTLAWCAGCAVSAGEPPAGLTIPGRGAADHADLLETVIRAVDGDTFVLSESGRVRLVGIDAPESVKPGTPVECHGKKAAAAATELEGKRVRVETDEVAGTRDIYGRKLVYLWYETDGDWDLYNLVAVRTGNARAYAHQDQRHAYRVELEAAELAAKNENLGLWACT